MNRMTPSHSWFAKRSFVRPSWRTLRTGFSLIEGIASATVIGGVFAMLVPSIASLRQASHQQEARLLATEEVRNVAERSLAEHESRRFDIAAISQLELREELKPYLPDAEWAAEATPLEDASGEAVSISLTYGRKNRRSVSLSIWLWEDNE